MEFCREAFECPTFDPKHIPEDIYVCFSFFFSHFIREKEKKWVYSLNKSKVIDHASDSLFLFLFCSTQQSNE